MVDFQKKEKYNFNDLLRIMEILRAPDGCMWDREQDHQSIRRNFIEETYEVCEAIDEQDPEHLKEELGDLLMQVVLHARIAEEEGLFTMDDVIQSIIDKMVRRHPHVFGYSDGPGTDGSQASWDEIKRQEKQGKEWTEEYLPGAFEEAKELIEAAKKRKGFDTKKAQ